MNRRVDSEMARAMLIMKEKIIEMIVLELEELCLQK